LDKQRLKNRGLIIATVIEGLFAVVATVLAAIFNSQLQGMQNQTQQMNVNVINTLGEYADGMNISETSNIEYVTDELMQAYLNEVNKTKKMEDAQSTGELEREALQKEVDALEQKNDTLASQNKTLTENNDELKKQADDLKSFILEKYSSNDVDRLIEEGFIKEKATERLDSLEVLDGQDYEQVPSVKDLYGTTHSISYAMYARRTGEAWIKFKLDGKYDVFSANVVTSQSTARNANMSIEIYVDNVLVGRADDIVRNEEVRPVSANVNGGSVLMIKVIGQTSEYDNVCYITDTEITTLE